MSNDQLSIIVALKDATKAGARTAVQSIDSIRKSADTAISSALNLKSALTSIGAGLALKDVMGTFMGFNDRMLEVQAITNASGDTMERMSALAQKMGADTRFSASQSADALKFLSMAGFDAEKAMSALPGVLDLASAGNLELGEAADIATNVLAGLQLPVEQLGRVNDNLALTASRANTDVRALGEAFKIAAPSAASSGMALEEVSAVLGGLADNGIRGGEAGNAVKRMLIMLQNPTKKAKDALKELGVTTVDTDGKFRGLIPVLQDLKNANMNLTQSSKIFGMYAATSAIAASGVSEKIANLSEELLDADGTTKRMATTMESGLGGALRALLSAWEGLRLTIGQGFSGAVTQTIKALTLEFRSLIEIVKQLNADGTLNTWASKIGEAFLQTVEYIKAFASGISTILTGLSPLISLFIQWSPELLAIAVGFKTLNIVVGLTSASMSLLNIAMSSTTWGTYLKHVIESTKHTNLFAVATASAGNALTIATGAVTAFFAGWQIGKIISASDLFGLLPLTVGEYVQIAIGKIDGMFSELYIKMLEIRKAWNDVTGDSEESASIALAIEAERQHLTEIQNTINSIKEKGRVASEVNTNQASQAREVINAETTAQNERIAVVESAEQQLNNILKKNADKYLKSIEETSEKAKKAYDERIEAINKAEASGAKSVDEALTERLKLEEEYNAERLKVAELGLEDVLEIYGKDTKEYKQALKAKESAANQYAATEQKVHDRIKKMNDIIADSEQSAQDKINSIRRKGMSDLELYKDKQKEYYSTLAMANQMSRSNAEGSIALYNKAMELASDLAEEVVDGERVIVSQSKAEQDAINMIKTAQAGLAQAARGQRDVIERSFSDMTSGGKTAEKSVSGATDAMENLSKKSDIGSDLEKALSPLKETYKLGLDTSKAVNSLDSIGRKAYETLSETYEVKLDTSSAEASIAKVKKELAELAKQSSSTHTVEIKGKASPVDEFTKTMGRVSTLMANFKSLVNDPSKQIVTIEADTSGHPESFTKATAGIISEYEDLKATFERNDIKGNITFGDELVNFQQSASLLKQTYSTLYSDMQAGIAKYGTDFATVSSAITVDTDTMIQGIKSGATSVSNDFATMGQGASAFSEDIREALITGNTEVFDEMTTSLQEYGTDFIDTMQAQSDATKAMADEVIAQGEEMMSALTEQIQSLSEEILSVSEEIDNIGSSTDDKLKEIRQNQQDDYTNWLEDREEAYAKYAEAQSALEAGNFELSKQLFLETQELASSLATTIEDENGKSLVSLGESSTLASELIQKAGDGATEALTEHKKLLVEQQEEARNQLSETEAVVDGLQSMSESMNDSMEEMMDRFTKNMESMLTTMVDEISTMASELKEQVEEPMTPQIDTNPISQAYQELADTQAKNYVLLKEQFKTYSGEVNYLSSKLRKATFIQMQEAQSEYKRLQSLANKSLSTNVNFYGTASPKKPLTETLNAVSAKFDALIAKAQQQINLNVQMTGTGSPTMPLSEKLSSMANALANFADNIPQPTMDILFNKNTALADIPEAIGAELSAITKLDTLNQNIDVTGMQNPFDNMKDWGRFELGQQEYIGSNSSISDLETTLRRERLTRN